MRIYEIPVLSVTGTCNVQCPKTFEIHIYKSAPPLTVICHLKTCCVAGLSIGITEEV